jgi:hypothetical protein
MDLYRQTHSNFDVGEKLHRGYTSPSFYPENKFGKPTPHNNEGIKAKKSLKWIFETEQNKATKIVSKRVDDFRERSQPQLGFPEWDSIKQFNPDTLLCLSEART